LAIIGFDTSNKAVAKNAGLGLLFQFLIRFKGIIILPFIVHFLTKEDLGSWRIVTTTTSLLIPIITLNLFDGSGMFFSSDFEINSVKLKYNTILGSVSLLFVTMFLPLAFILNKLSVTRIFCIPILIYLFTSIAFKAAVMLYQVYQKSKILVLINLIVEYGSAILTIILLLVNRNYWSLLLPIYFVTIIITVLLFLRVYKEIEFRFHIDKTFLARVLKISIPLIPVFITEWLLSFIGVYMLGYFGQLDEVGDFSVVLSISGIFLTLRATLQFFWFSTCSNLLGAKKIDEFNSLYKLTIKAYMSIIFIGLLVYIFFARDIIKVLTSMKFVHLTDPVILTVSGYAFLIFSSIYNGILYALENTKKILISYIISSLTVVLMGYLLIPEFKIWGATLSMLVGNLMLQLLLQYFSWKIKILKRIDGLLPTFGISLLIIVSSFYLNHLNINMNLSRSIGITVLIIYIFYLIKIKFIPFEIISGYLMNRIKRLK
jgi:O-antigen/teichoic acid export membrane protein